MESDPGNFAFTGFMQQYLRGEKITPVGFPSCRYDPGEMETHCD